MKLTLTIQSGKLAGQSFELLAGMLSIGRGEGSDVRFDPFEERIASKRHCQIEEAGGEFFIVDNNSTNGTILNGRPIMREKLATGDRIQFGRNGVEGVVEISGADSRVTAPQAAVVSELFSAPPSAAYSGGPAPTSSGLSMSFRNSFAGLGGAGDLAPEAESKSATGAIIGFAIGILAVLAMTGVVFLILAWSIGIVPTIIATVIAFPPAMLYILPILGLDRYDPEPAWLLGFAFAWGGLVAVFVSFVGNTAVGLFATLSTASPVLGQLIGAVISAPIVEEGSKGLGVLLITLFFRKYLDDILDGVVYAAVVALGFATVENVLYYGRGLHGGVGMLGILFFMRGILSPFAHVTFTAMTGIGCGIARESYKGCVKWIWPLVGYAGAVFLHGLWNLMASVLGLGGFLLGYLVLEIPLFCAFIGFCIYVMRRQSRIIREMLVMQVVQGIVTQEEVDLVASPFKSTIWKYKGLFTGKGLARHKFVRAVGKLGLSQWHIQQAQAAGGVTASLQQNPILRAQVIRLRQEI